jgi:hypothetical protein
MNSEQNNRTDTFMSGGVIGILLSKCGKLIMAKLKWSLLQQRLVGCSPYVSRLRYMSKDEAAEYVCFCNIQTN